VRWLFKLHALRSGGILGARAPAGRSRGTSAGGPGARCSLRGAGAARRRHGAGQDHAVRSLPGGPLRQRPHQARRPPWPQASGGLRTVIQDIWRRSGARLHALEAHAVATPAGGSSSPARRAALRPAAASGAAPRSPRSARAGTRWWWRPRRCWRTGRPSWPRAAWAASSPSTTAARRASGAPLRLHASLQMRLTCAVPVSMSPAAARSPCEPAVEPAAAAPQSAGRARARAHGRTAPLPSNALLQKRAARQRFSAGRGQQTPALLARRAPGRARWRAC
jgi:hypothetical protein